ncbi:MAG: alpha/beta fold hydrolase [Myxococcales bacterium]|nr:alpha/beta fold hydrolase [Myxococcales bacterium]
MSLRAVSVRACHEPEAELLYVLHGFLGDETALDGVTSRIASRFARVERWVLPGHKREPWSASWTFDAVVDRLIERCSAVEPGVIVGYSMGARIALAMILRAPERFSCAALVGVDPGIDDAPTREARLRWERAMADELLRDGTQAFAARWSELEIFASQRSLPGPVREALSLRRSQHDPEGIAWAMRALGTGSMPSRWGALAGLAVPTVVVTGELDKKFTAISATMAERSPRVARCVVEGVGHDVTLEAPEAVVDALQTLIARSSVDAEK